MSGRHRKPSTLADTTGSLALASLKVGVVVSAVSAPVVMAGVARIVDGIELRISAFSMKQFGVCPLLDDVSGFDVDQMIVMTFRRGFVAGAAVAEIVPLEDAGLLEQADGAVDGGDRDAGIDRRGARVQRLYVGMILGFAEHAGDDLALLGDPQALFGAERFDIYAAGHVPRS